MRFVSKSVATFRAQIYEAPSRVEDALRRLEEFCRKLGGSLHVPALYPELGVVECYIPRRLSIKDLAEAISELTTRLRETVKQAVGDLGEFSIIEGGMPERRTTFRPGLNAVTVEDAKYRTYPINPGDIEYVYPDPVSDMDTTHNSRVSVVAWGVKSALEHGEVRAYGQGRAWFRGEQKPDSVAEKLRKMYAMLEEILSNPLNFFKLRK